METGLAESVVIVTGGGGGIGAATAHAFARESARVVIADRDLAAAQSVAAALRQLDKKALAVAVDVADESSIAKLIGTTLEEFGRVDALVNNAGIFQAKSIDELSLADWDQMFDVNLRGAFLCARAVLPSMRQQRSGRIVNLGSLAGQVGGVVAGAHYSASKAGLICLTKSLAKSCGPFNITVNTVNPGYIDTPPVRTFSAEAIEGLKRQTPLGRLGTPDEVAQVIVFLCSKAASFIQGAQLDVNGGVYMG